jgi:cytochrome b pre-mRNA-processing protein 3
LHFPALLGKSMILKSIFARKPSQCEVLYRAIVAAARQEKYYADWGVPDTLDGRFDMIVLHLFLVLERLKGDEHQAFRQDLTDFFFRDMDRSLREMGVGDLAVGKKVRKMAEVFYGRITAYAAAAESEDKLTEALTRNVFAGATPHGADRLMRWAVAARQSLAGQEPSQMRAGEVSFP